MKRKRILKPTNSGKHGFFNAATPGQRSPNNENTHSVILQALNRKIRYGSDRNPRVIFYGVDNFTGTEPLWNSTKVVFVRDATHPDMDLFLVNPALALKKVNGREAGYISGSEVLTGPGQPRLESQMTFTDQETADLYNAGRLGVSTALYCSVQNGALDGKVLPNHIMVFETSDEAQPRDLGSMFLNSEKPDTEALDMDALDKVLTEFSNSVKAIFKGQTNEPPEDDDDMDPELSKKLALANSTIEARDQELKELNEKLKTANEQLTNSQKDLEKYRTEEADRVWTGLKNSTIPPGLIETPEMETELRTLYNSDRDGFYGKILAVKDKAPGSGKQGKQHMNSNKVKVELQEANEKWNQATGAGIKKA